MEEAVLNKLKIDKHEKIAVLNAPEEFLNILGTYAGIADKKVQGEYTYIQLFIYSQQELVNIGESLANAISGDGFLWICYPKGTSKKYKKADCNRDTIRGALTSYGFEGVSLISLDENWSAMRLRNSAYIKSKK